MRWGEAPKPDYSYFGRIFRTAPEQPEPSNRVSVTESEVFCNLLQAGVNIRTYRVHTGLS